MKPIAKIWGADWLVIFELVNAIDPLTNRTAQGGQAEDAFEGRY
jgi:hypothetical protein